jgi:hypothetical protein
MLKIQFSQTKKFLNFKNKKLMPFFGISFFCFLLILLPFSIKAEMQSANYVIYENVMHSFDGPIISGVSDSVSGQTVIVSWTTNVNADSFVIYDTDNTFISSREQGNSNKENSAHSVELSGLEANMTYYYRVRSERVNGGITTDSTINSFTTGSDDTGEAPSSGGGGGILIIDKTDKIAPIITNVNTQTLNTGSVEVTWDTDEEATSFVEYGLNENYGTTYGSWGTSTSHSLALINLKEDTNYYYRALSSDSWGNLAYSEEGTFYTGEGEPPLTEEEELEEEEEVDPGIIIDASQKVLDFIRRLFPQVALNDLGSNPIDDINSLEDITNFIPMPILSGEPRVEIGATQVSVFWQTDVDANSLVALAPEESYRAGAEEPYRQIVGNSEEMTIAHEVTLYNLEPGTTYHYQLRSKSEIGPLATSRDYTFTTNLEEIKITSFFTTIVDDQTAIFKWVTNKEADSGIKYAPYHGNVLAVDESKTLKDNTQAVIHELKIENLVGGTFYDVEIVSMDMVGNVASESLARFSTREDDLPPILSNIKTDSTVFLDRSNKTQTIISWLSNEPSTSRVYYQEGVHGGTEDLNESTDLNTNYTKEHVMVVTKFKPGIVYSFRIESIDSGGNVVISSPHTFMTAKKKESIIQIIMNILENTFGWMKKLM